MLTLAISNQKGGVGKTTLSVHLAVGLALQGHKTLLLDVDPQAHSTGWALGDEWPDDAPTAFDALTRGTLSGRMPLASPLAKGLFVLPSEGNKISKAEATLANEPGRERLLGEALSELQGIDFVIIDTPPAVGIQVLSSLCASDAVVAPVTPSFFSLEGLKSQEVLIQTAQKRLQARVQVLGYVLFASDRRESTPAQVRGLLPHGMVFDQEIRVSSAAKALPGHRKTAWDDGMDARGAEDYAALLDETLNRLSTRKQEVARG